jgi:hypothetical protein
MEALLSSLALAVTDYSLTSCARFKEAGMAGRRTNCSKDFASWQRLKRHHAYVGREKVSPKRRRKVFW